MQKMFQTAAANNCLDENATPNAFGPEGQLNFGRSTINHFWRISAKTTSSKIETNKPN
jgi:hypothetical protein